MVYRKHTYMRLDGSSKISERRDMVADFQSRWVKIDMIYSVCVSVCMKPNTLFLPLTNCKSAFLYIAAISERFNLTCVCIYFLVSLVYISVQLRGAVLLWFLLWGGV